MGSLSLRLGIIPVHFVFVFYFSDFTPVSLSLPVVSVSATIDLILWRDAHGLK
jgi:hypothetical protein